MNAPRPERPADSQAISRAAADWLVKRDRGFTAQEQDEFSAWLAADSRHGAWFARHQQTWQSFDLLGDWRPAHSAEPNPDLLARPRRRVRWFVPVVLAAAAALAVAIFQQRPAPAVQRDTVAQSASLVFSSPDGYDKHTLEDGTVIELNRGASVRVDYSPAQRRVQIVSGEAYFAVAKNPARPFFVHAGDVSVRAVGTAFNVRLGPTAVEILVTEGKVQVASTAVSPEPAAQPLLVAGQLAVVSLGTPAPAAVTTVTSADQSRLLAWQPRLLEFDSTPLREVVATFNRHNRTQLRLADERLADLPIVASIRSDNLDAFVRLLELTAATRAERHGETEIVLSAREPAGDLPAGR